MKLFAALLIVTSFTLRAQDVKVEYDKSKDYSHYKTFKFGQSEIVTPKEKKQISDKELNKLIQDAISNEMKEKGLTYSDSSAELIITYVAGIFEHSEIQNLGPLGTSPNSSSQTWTSNYSQGELIVDLNDAKTSKLIWRINSQTNTTTPEARQYIEQIIDKGLKKFGVKPKQKKK